MALLYLFLPRTPDKITASDIERFILNLSKGLTKVTKSKTPTVQFIHESVKDYLLKENGLNDIWPDLQANVNGYSHERLKQCCLNYIAIGKTASLELAANAKPEEAKSQRQLANSSFPFLEYAVKNVLYHANEAEAHGANQPEVLKEFPLDDWIQLDNFLEKYETRRHKRNVSFLYILAEFNMSHLIRRHLDILSFLSVEQERYGTPLFAALAMNSSMSLRAFLDAYLEIEPSFRDIVNDYYSNGVERNNLGRSFRFSRTHSFRDFIRNGATLAVAFSFKITGVNVYLDSPSRDELIITAARGHKSILKLFLDNWSYENIDHSALLSAAISNGHEAIADFLLGNGAKIDCTDINGRTFLSIAAEKGLYSLVERSLNDSVDLNVQYRGRTPLSYAVQSGNEPMVKLLLSKGAEIDIRDDSQRTPLSYAVQSGNEPMVKLLLSKGAEIDIRDSSQRTLLSYSVHAGSEAMVKLVLSKGTRIDDKDLTNRTPLSYAAQFSKAFIVQLLIDGGAEINTQDKERKTPLLYGVEAGNESIVEVLLHGGADPEIKDSHGRTPLLAAYNASRGMVELLLDKGAKINVQDSAGRTPLSCAVRYGCNESVAKLLLERGADVDVKDNNGMAPLSHAIYGGFSGRSLFATIQLLLERGADVKATDHDGRTPLSHAVSIGYDGEDTIQLLLERGAGVDAKDNHGKTPLFYAVSARKNQAKLQLLLEWGANVNAQDDSGKTPLSHAVLIPNNQNTVQLLLEWGADANVRDNNGKTTLSHAVLMPNNQEIIQLLLEKGADVNVRDKNGKTPLLHLSTAPNYQNMVQLLLKAGAKWQC